MQQNKKNDTKAYVISFIAMGAVVVLYSLIFPMYRWQHYLIVAGIALLVGRVVFIMAQGLDTSKEAPAQQPIPKTGDGSSLTLWSCLAFLSAVAMTALFLSARKRKTGK